MVYGVLDAYSPDALRIGVYGDGSKDIKFMTFNYDNWKELQEKVLFDFEITQGMLKASGGVKEVDRLSYDITDCVLSYSLVDLLIFMIKKDARFILGSEERRVDARKIRVSRSTLTLGVSYLDVDGWHTEKIAYNSKTKGLTQTPFKFEMEAEVIPEWLEGKVEKIGEENGKTIYQYGGELFIAPMLESKFYILSTPYLHERLNTAMTCEGMSRTGAVVSGPLIAKMDGDSEVAYPERKTYDTDVSKSGVHVKGPTVTEGDIAEIISWLKGKSGNAGKDLTMTEYIELVRKRNSDGWKVKAFEYLVSIASHQGPEVTKVVRLVEDKKKFEVKETIALLDVWRHRVYMYFNDVDFYMPGCDFPVENLLLQGGFSPIVFELKKEWS